MERNIDSPIGESKTVAKQEGRKERVFSVVEDSTNESPDTLDRLVFYQTKVIGDD